MDWVALYEDWDAEELGEGEGERKVVFDEWCSRVQKLEPSADEECPTLLELCCRVAGRALPFQLVQEAPSPFDRDVQRRVAYWSFPSCYSDIRRYIELSSGSPEAARATYQSAASLSLASHVQIGTCVIGKFSPLPSGHTPVMAKLQLDRGCIIDTSCTCDSAHLWCPHTTALVVKEMNERSKSSPANPPLCPLLRPTHPPLSESLSELSAVQLRKVLQYLVSECGDPSVLLIVQRLLDQVRDESSDISQTSGAPDLTAGGGAGDVAVWCLNADSVYSVATRSLQGIEDDSQGEAFWSLLSAGDPNAGVVLRERVRAFTDVTSSTDFTNVCESNVFFQFCDSLVEWSSALLTSSLTSPSVIRSVVEGVSEGMAALQQKEGSLLSQQLCMLFSAHLSLVVRAAEVLREMSVASLQQLIGGQAGLGHLQSKVKVATDPVGLFSALLAVTISSEDSDHTHNMATNLASVLFPSGTSQSFASSCVINVALAGLSPDMVNYFGILLLQRMTDVQQRVLLGLQIIGSHHSLHPDPTVEYSCICCEMGVLDHAAEVGLQSDWSECISLAVSHLQEQSGCVLTRLHLAQFLWTVVGEGGRRALTQICKDIIKSAMPSSLASPSLPEFVFKMTADSVVHLVQSMLKEGGSAVQGEVVTALEEMLLPPLPYAESLDLCLRQAAPHKNPGTGHLSDSFQGPTHSTQPIDISLGTCSSTCQVTLLPQHDPEQCDMKDSYPLADCRDVAVLRCISEAAEEGLPPLLQLRLRLAYLRAANSQCVHWAVMETHRLQLLSAAQLGHLVKEVGPAGHALLVEQWPSCLSPEDVVRVLTAANIHTTDGGLVVGLMMSLLSFAGQMSDASLVQVLGACAHQGAGQLVAAIQTIMCSPSVSSDVLFSAFTHLENTHKLGMNVQHTSRGPGLLVPPLPQRPSPELLLLALQVGRQAVMALVKELSGPSSVDACLYPSYEDRLIRYASLCCSLGVESVSKFLEALVPPDRPCPVSPMALSHVALHIASHLSQRNPHHKRIYLTQQPLARVIATSVHRYEELVTELLLRVDTMGYQTVLDLLSDMESVGCESELCRQTFVRLLAGLVNEPGARPKLRQLLSGKFGNWLPKDSKAVGGRAPRKQRGGSSRRSRGRHGGQHSGPPPALE